MMIKSSIPILIKIVLTSLLTGLIGLCATAQKLPNVQKSGLRTPARVKVDGKPNEWGSEFQAYNHATGIYYTMANDDENLYLTVQATDPDIIMRITGGGVMLGIQKTADKKDKNAITVTYPITGQTLYFNLRKKKNADEDTTAKAADSLMNHNNAQIDINCKWIKVSGIAGVDTLISVYNSDGIKAAGKFNNKKVYTCEIALKLKLLNVSINNAAKFTYHIKLNGAKPITVSMGYATPGNEALMEQLVAKVNQTASAQSAPTDFWGEYVLVK